MTLRIHTVSPENAVEAVFFRIQHTSMVDVPILNPALSVQAVDFQRWQGHWLGMVITPWCMSVLLVPGSAEQWDRVGANQRRFVKFPAGDFAFLDSSEVELGDFQSCALFSPMDKFSTQSEALMTARASLIGLLSPPPTAQVEKAEAAGGQAPGLSRRGFLAFHKA